MLDSRLSGYGTNISIALVAVIVIASIFSSARAADLYPFEMKKKYPRAFAAYQKMVPARFHKVAWIYSLEATAGPMEIVQCGGKQCLAGWLCQPHNCGGNELAYLVAVDGTNAVGLLRSNNLTKGKDVLFGKPDTAQLELLKKQLNQE